MTKMPTPWSREQLEARYGDFYEIRARGLDPARVPERLRDLVPLAEVWGVADDVEREQLVASAPRIAQADLMDIVQRYKNELNAWLAGPEADSRAPSAEYLAMTHMRMARYSI